PPWDPRRDSLRGPVPGFATGQLHHGYHPGRRWRPVAVGRAMSRPLPKIFDLSGQTALVTGAGGLLGPQHAIALAELGAKVVLADIDLDKADAAAALVR